MPGYQITLAAEEDLRGIWRYTHAKHHTPRILLGGIEAGLLLTAGELILDGVVLSGDWEPTSINPEATTYGTWLSLAIMGVVFLNGFPLTWLYAAMRPRFGPEPKTAILAGLVLWLIARAMMGLSLILGGMVTPRFAMISATWGLFEVPLAAVTGAWFYCESRQNGSLA